MPSRPAFLMVAACTVTMLAACSGGQEKEPAGEEAAQAESPASETLETMPEEFVAQWDFAEQDCGSDASEMQLRIEPSLIEFYESIAEPRAIQRNGPRSLTVTHAFSGEGETWEETLAYELNEDGDRLTVTTPEGSMSVRVKCP